MKKQFAKLSKAEQEEVELEYLRMKPEGFDEAMAQAKTTQTDRNLDSLAEGLERPAEDYQGTYSREDIYLDHD